ncbi:thermostable hemolysin [Motiliproteus sediminis]|uniref:thermostable hemolysin n=1 Tax=Motiliproteus sediminis TaxID=1468178 RepID=UPI001AEFFC93|nr:thermostable hemolysin [Motiliproteus sediminis]
MGRLELVKQLSCNGQGELVLVQSPENRAHVEAFIRDRFLHEHGAKPHHFAPHLVALTDTHNQIQACLGYQGAHEGELFLEQYLDQPVEALISRLEGAPVQRRAILEVGNLASRYSGCTRRVILSLARYFCEQQYQWLVITATPRVLNTFSKLGVGLELIPLANARPERLGSHAADWGRYYDSQPQVVAARFSSGLQKLFANPLFRQLMRRSPRPHSDQGILIAGAVA